MKTTPPKFGPGIKPDAEYLDFVSPSGEFLWSSKKWRDAGARLGYNWKEFMDDEAVAAFLNWIRAEKGDPLDIRAMAPANGRMYRVGMAKMRQGANWILVSHLAR